MTTTPTRSHRKITLQQFKSELTAQGVPREHFAVVCVSCGTVQSRQDFVKAGASPTIEAAQLYWGFSCIGRHNPAIGCDWTLGGLFTIHTLEIDTEDGEKPFPCFEPATPGQALEHAKSAHGFTTSPSSTDH